MALVKIWDKEIKGKLWAVGDIHGCYNLLMTQLKEIGFDFENDLLVAVGDPSELAMWGRDRLDEDKKQYTHVSGIDAVIMGHTVTQKPCKRDNCYWIDTGAVHWGTMTILDLSKI